MSCLNLNQLTHMVLQSYMVIGLLNCIERLMEFLPQMEYYLIMKVLEEVKIL